MWSFDVGEKASPCVISLLFTNEQMSNDKWKMFRHHSDHENISCDFLFLDHGIHRLHRIQIGGFAISQQQSYCRSIFDSDK